MFETDRSASRGEMAPQKLIVFEHKSPFGNAPANKLFERVKVQRKNDAAAKSSNGSTNGDWSPARSFTDYTVRVDESGSPSGIKIHQKI